MGVISDAFTRKLGPNRIQTRILNDGCVTVDACQLQIKYKLTNPASYIKFDLPQELQIVQQVVLNQITSQPQLKTFQLVDPNQFVLLGSQDYLDWVTITIPAVIQPYSTKPIDNIAITSYEMIEEQLSEVDRSELRSMYAVDRARPFRKLEVTRQNSDLGGLTDI